MAVVSDDGLSNSEGSRSKLRPLAGFMGSTFGAALAVSLLAGLVALGVAVAIFATRRNTGREIPVVLSHPEQPASVPMTAGEQPMPGTTAQASVVVPITRHDGSLGKTCAAANSQETEKAYLATKSLEEQLRVASAGRQWLSSQAGYTATFVRQERVHDVLHPTEEMRIVLRHAPFAVRLDWLQSGQRVAYVDGENDNMLLVRLGGARRIFGTLKLDPNGGTAMGSCRYPITEVGLWNMADRVCRECERALKQTSGVTFERMPDEPVADRPCAVYVIKYQLPTFDSDCRSIRFSIDQEWGVPLRFRATGWCESANVSGADGDGLLEFYEYRDVAFVDCVDPADFNLAKKLVH